MTSLVYTVCLQAHLYSLGMTLLFAAEYNVSMSVQRPFSPDLAQTINRCVGMCPILR